MSQAAAPWCGGPGAPSTAWQAAADAEVRRLEAEEARQPAAARNARVWSAHAVSNLRQIEPAVRADETPAERRLRLRLRRDYAWNHAFWRDNNSRFQQVRSGLAS